MALVLADRVKETSTTTGTGTYTLAGAVSGFETFGSIGNGNTTYYACTLGADFEVGIGTYTASGTTLARTTILQSSNSDNAVSWGSGTKTLFCTQPAEKAVFRDASGNVSVSGTITGTGTSVFTNLDISGDVDVDGTLESDAITLGGVAVPSISSTSTLTNKTLTTPVINGFSGTGDGSIIGDLTLKSTDDGSAVEPVLKLVRDSASPADSDFLGQVTFLGDNDAGEQITYAKLFSKIIDVTDGTEDGNFTFNVMSGGSSLTVLNFKGNGSTTFSSKDVLLGTGVDLRFEGSSANAHETTITPTNPTQDNTLTLPNVSGTFITTGNSDSPSTTTSSSDADFVLIDDGGTMKKITPANLGVPANKDFGLVTGSVTGTEDFGSVA